MKFKPGTILSVLSLSISLFVLGVYLIILVHVNNLVKIVNEKTPFIIELKDSLDKNRINALISEFKDKEYVIDTKYISKDDGLKLLSKELGDDLLLEDEVNPLKDIIRIKLRNSFIVEGSVPGLIQELESDKSIEKCTFEKESVDALKSNLKSLNSIFLFLGIVFILISFILIYNNLKFILHADRFTIKTMELIGASPSFVKRPYLKLALKIGVFSALIAIILLIASLLFLNIKYSIFDSIVDFSTIVLVILFILILSLVAPPLFINSIVKKYLVLSDRGRYT